MSPQRIQLCRTKGWRKPEGAIVVARPSKWGNPWVLKSKRWPDGWTAEQAVAAHRTDIEWSWRDPDAAKECGHYCGFTQRELVASLSGHDLACWCPLDQPCHADVLLELANR